MKDKNTYTIYGIHWGFHVAFWLLLVSLLYLDYYPWIYDEEMNIDKHKQKDPVTLALLSTLVSAVFAYIHLHFIKPKLTEKKSNQINAFKIGVYLILLIALGLFNGFLFDFAAEKAASFGWMTDEQNDKVNYLRNIPEAILSMVCLTGVVVSLTWYQENVELVSENRVLTNQKRIFELEMELQGWRMEKHFMINLFASLYVLADTNQEQFLETVRALKNTMSYVFYDCRESKGVPVYKEVELLQNYILLRKVRHGENDKGIAVNLPENMEQSIKIVPLVLVEFLENAFKHGYDTFSLKHQDQRWIKVNLAVTEKELYYEVSNAKLPDSLLKKSTSSKGKYGLESIEKRLSNRYGNQYELNINQTETTHSVILKINF